MRCGKVMRGTPYEASSGQHAAPVERIADRRTDRDAKALKELMSKCNPAAAGMLHPARQPYISKPAPRCVPQLSSPNSLANPLHTHDQRFTR